MVDWNAREGNVGIPCVIWTRSQYLLLTVAFMGKLLASPQRPRHRSPSNRPMQVDVEQAAAKSEILGAPANVQ